MVKKIFPYFLVIVSCIAAYSISESIISKQFNSKQVSYASDTVSEVSMVWGTMDNKLPPKDYWPSGSYLKDNMIWTPMNGSKGEFITTIQLSPGTAFYYWMVQRKDTAGNKIEIWDSGGDDKEFFTDHISYNGMLRPGYFIFLAGFLPLFLLYFKNRNKQIQATGIQQFTIKDYVPQFDSIRAIAVLLVIVHHWLPEKSILNILPNGRLGVNIFFVLSGFLITGILLKAKKQTETAGLKKGTVFTNFYIRRTLRIFPIYYLLLFIFLVLNDPALHENGVYYFTYTSNYLFYAKEFFPAHFAHLWSLAVEEQFYILWPWLIVLVNKKYLPYLITLFIVIGISSNYIIESKDWWKEILTPACFDAFAIGGLLSYCIAYQPGIIEQIQPRFKWIFCIILLLFILDVFDYSFLPRRTTHALLAIAVIYYCLFKRNNSVMNFVLNNKWLIRMGKVSYGIYLYHLFVPELWGWIIKKFASWNIDLLYNKAMPEMFQPGWLFLQRFSFLILICIISWNLIEKPINNLKKRFENKAPVEKKLY